MVGTTIEFSSDEAEDYLLEITTSSAVELAKAIFRTNPIETHVLRSHLWIEREIEQILAQLFPFPEAIIEGRFTFSHKLTLLKGFWGNEPQKSDLLSKLDILNKIRNQMAHNLNSSKIPSLFSKLGVDYQLDEHELPSDEMCEKVKIGLAELHGGLIGQKGMLLLGKAGHSIMSAESSQSI